jgi:hypothetical protein
MYLNFLSIIINTLIISSLNQKCFVYTSFYSVFTFAIQSINNDFAIFFAIIFKLLSILKWNLILFRNSIWLKGKKCNFFLSDERFSLSSYFLTCQKNKQIFKINIWTLFSKRWRKKKWRKLGKKFLIRKNN